MLVPIADPGVVFYPQTTALDGDHTSGAATLLVQDAGELEPDGLLAVDGIDNTFTYALTDLSASTVAITPTLPTAADADTTVTALDAQGKPLGVLKASVVLHEGEEPTECPVKPILREKFTEGADMVGQMVDLDADRNIVDLPGQKPYIDPMMLLPNVVESDTTPKLPNGTFEQLDPLGLTPFAEWHASWPILADWRIEAVEDANTIAGSRSLGIVLDSDTAYGTVVTNQKWPVRGGQVIGARVSVRADRDISGATPTDGLAAIRLQTAPEDHDPDEIFSSAVWQDFKYTSTLTTDEIQVLEGQVTVPVGHSWMRIQLQANRPADGLGPVTVIFDEVTRTDTATVSSLDLDSSTTIVDGVPLATYILGVVNGKVKTFTATASKVYDGAGNGQSWVGIYTGQDQAHPTIGNRKAGVWFDSTAISTWVAGRTITKVSLGFYVVNYDAASGSKLEVGWHTDSTVRSTYAAITGKAVQQQEVTDPPKGAMTWVDLTGTLANWGNGTNQGIIFGPGLTTATTYGFYLAGAATGDPPQLRIEVA